MTFQTTPNPNALKCVLGVVISDRPRSYFTAEEAKSDRLGAALFAIEGVTNVLIQDTWFTVCKRPDEDWKPIKRALEQVVASHVSTAQAGTAGPVAGSGGTRGGA